jgi:hypothetical protein
MKSFAVVLLFGIVVFAQESSTPISPAPGCGTASVKFDVKTDKSPHGLIEPPPGQAIVYFVEDDTEFESTPKPTTRIGVDGTWVGANHGNSYFSFAVAPGVHHLCASWQSRAVIGAHDTQRRGSFHGGSGTGVLLPCEEQVAARACCDPRRSVARR